MSNTTNRRGFLKYIGLAAATTVVTPIAFANDFIKSEEIIKLTQPQQAFMIKYGVWMDEFIAVIRNKKAGLDTAENKTKMLALTVRAERFRPEVNEFMEDKTFSYIYQTAIERMSKEI